MSRKKITLSASEVTALKTKALAQVEAERKKEAENELLAKLVQEARAEFDSNEEMIEHEILLPPYTSVIQMDGRQFHHGTKVTLRRSQYDSLIEIEAKAWRHDDIVFGRVDDPHALRSLHKSRGTREAAPNSMGVLRA